MRHHQRGWWSCGKMEIDASFSVMDDFEAPGTRCALLISESDLRNQIWMPQTPII
jgi:hypothetical protein